MGIPSYFQHIINNYEDIFHILKNVKETNKKTNLYLDSNSIIYDSLNNIEYGGNNIEYELLIYKEVCKKIEDYIKLLEPTGIVIIAFDGVAPVAKLEQQRTRRLKSQIISELEKEVKVKYDNSIIHKKCWDKASITPGTKFMDELNNYIKRHFSLYKNNKIEKIIVSGSDDYGEGEHKIFEFIRNNEEYHNKSRTYIYGLDADLIILSLNHLYLCDDIYLFREKPEYDKNLKEIYGDEKHCFMRVKELENNIINSMIKIDNKIYNKSDKIRDYCFLSFFLGNDFLPHNPTLNIRTNGLTIVIESYKKIVNNNESICKNNVVNWKILKKLINEFSLNEREYLVEEHKKIEKQLYFIESGRSKMNDTSNNKEYELKKLNNKPMYNRDSEIYINPCSNYWKERYYEELFGINDYISDEMYRGINKGHELVKDICINYLEGMEWILKYYSIGCVNTMWKYKYHYPPLFSDLVKYVPDFVMDIVEKNNNKIISKTQLCYVLPEKSYNLLPDELKQYMLLNYKNEKSKKLIHKYCKYLWESHLDLENININKLDNDIKNIISI
jgi:5'-3' exonuclease